MSANPGITTHREPASPATWLATRWARVYTAGVTAEQRQRRRAEVASDSWEHVHGAGSTLVLETSLAWRVIRGMPSDIAWRGKWKGAPEMRTRGIAEYVAGGGLLVMVGMLLAGILMDPGIDTSREGFRASFTDASGNTQGALLSAIAIYVCAVMAVAGGIGMMLALWRAAPIAAVLMGVLLIAFGLGLVAAASIGLAMRELLIGWRESGFNSAELLDTARPVAVLRERTIFAPTVAPIAAFIVLGGQVLWRGLLPRWLGVLSIAGAVMFATGLAAEIAGAGTLVWVMWMLSLLLALCFFTVVALVLLLSGVRTIATPAAAIARP
jgi:hypothetical protein